MSATSSLLYPPRFDYRYYYFVADYHCYCCYHCYHYYYYGYFSLSLLLLLWFDRPIESAKHYHYWHLFAGDAVLAVPLRLALLGPIYYTNVYLLQLRIVCAILLLRLRLIITIIMVAVVVDILGMCVVLKTSYLSPLPLRSSPSSSNEIESNGSDHYFIILLNI